MHARVPGFALFVIALLAGPAAAQTQWLQLAPRSNVRLEIGGSGAREFEGGTLAAALFASARVATGAHTWIVGEVPFAHAHPDDVLYLASDGVDLYASQRNTFGNAYLGVEHATHVRAVHYEFGLRLPLADPEKGDALVYGRAAGVEHEDAFVPHTLHLRGALGWHHAVHARTGVGFDARVAPVWAIVTSNPIRFFDYEGIALYQPHHVSRLLLDYDANTRVEGPNARLAVGVAGRWAPSGSEVGYEPANVTELTILVELVHDRVRPGLALRIPFDGKSNDAPDTGRSAFFSLTVPFGPASPATQRGVPS